MTVFEQSHLNLFILVFPISKTKSCFGIDPTAAHSGALRKNMNFKITVGNGRESRIMKIHDLVIKGSGEKEIGVGYRVRFRVVCESVSAVN